MEITTIIDPRIVKTNMAAESKGDVLNQLTTLLLDAGYITDIEGFIRDIYTREEEGMTGIGNYIAIPHGKSAFVKEVGVAIGVLENEIPWETLDGKGVKGIILFAVGNDTAGAKEHLKLLSLFARKLGNDEVIKNLLLSKNADEVMKAFEL
ncbi:fructose PTS transporter subunit IIA [Trichococcus pasteurii]|uniref:Phosphoenolpyruvate-dependent sugar phosphotransferase system eiia 2 n=1 Tax=Trichococcus pasteurii TaxID=43064 RepID=A0A1W1IG08_9LACT|nr:fructose PTS transporter subunit IIA [Trichococcus pasteurii]SFE98444.1 PTS system, fructose-specific IIA component [Trichococcus pasteurii]SLM51948.1 phosphoenolpyruvate-dependent sugar phosphotransferase system eiia 2 [Trichococcus pasteurii]SSB92829.1 phosphoenolpyruvate-dependent sugar phosphotransferase system eiia 2 [Trichococcus pasteurii]